MSDYGASESVAKEGWAIALAFLGACLFSRRPRVRGGRTPMDPGRGRRGRLRVRHLPRFQRQAQGKGGLVSGIVHSVTTAVGRWHTARRRITPSRLILALVVVPIAVLGLAACNSPSSTTANGAHGDASGTTTGTRYDTCNTFQNSSLGVTCTTNSSGQVQYPYSGPVAQLADQVGQNKVAINFVWTLVTGYLVMFMQAGFALVETGFTGRSRPPTP